MRADIREGGKFPNYELPDHTGVMRKLSFLQGDDPMVLLFYRGNFCPKDRTHLDEMVRFSRQCVVGYTKIVSVVTAGFLSTNELRQSHGAWWPFLYDKERMVPRDLEIEEYTDTKHNPVIPFTFVLEPGLLIYKIYNGYWYWGRPSVSELHLNLRDIASRIRPDYRLDTDEMRKKWQRGEKECFWPYEKPMKKAVAQMAWNIEQYDKE